MFKIKKDKQVVLHQGYFKQTSTTTEATFLVAGVTIGAGILGIPFAVAQVGLVMGIAMIIALGFIMLALNLMIGEVAVRTGEDLQLPGLAGKYLGSYAKHFVSFMMILRSLGALLAYVVGAGIALQAILGGLDMVWSLIFWTITALFIWGGIHRVKKAEKFLGFALLAIVIFVSLHVLRDFDFNVLTYFDATNFFLPFGIILFAFSGSPAIAEAHALLSKSEKKFERSLIYGTLIPMFIYVLFTLAVVGVGGAATTAVATVGLGVKYGIGVLVLANLFAVLSLGTSYMGVGIALKETLVWDYKRTPLFAAALVIFLPLVLFFISKQNFILILEVVGGIFISAEAAVMIWVYWKARQQGDIKPKWFVLHNAILVALPVFIFFAVVALASLVNLILK